MPYQDKQLKKEFITVDNRTIPFGYPQFWGGDDWEVSGRDNPLPVANYTQNEQGLWVPVSNVNPVPTQLTGSNVEDVVLVNSYAINNTSYHDFKIENSHNYRKILVKYRSTLDKNIRLYVREASGQPFWRILIDNSYRSYWGVLKPNGASIDIVNDSIVQLDELVGESFMFSFRAEETPTEGSLSVWVTGVM